MSTIRNVALASALIVGVVIVSHTLTAGPNRHHRRAKNPRGNASGSVLDKNHLRPGIVVMAMAWLVAAAEVAIPVAMAADEN